MAGLDSTVYSATVLSSRIAPVPTAMFALIGLTVIIFEWVRYGFIAAAATSVVVFVVWLARSSLLRNWTYTRHDNHGGGRSTTSTRSE
jgi:hypothetical protein